MCPVSVRAKDGHGAMGNQISALLVQLATDVADPLERLAAIHRHTESSKSYSGAVGATTMMDFAEFIPFGLAGSASRLYTRFRVAEKLRPVFNTCITNVPGPQTDLYIAGHKLLANMGMAPILDGIGLVITVLSYNGVLAISPITSPEIMPIDNFTRMIRESANELEAAVASAKPAAARVPRSTANLTATTTEFFGRVRSNLERVDAPGIGTFQFRVTGAIAANWVIELAERKVTEGEAASPSATFTVRDNHLAKFNGELDPRMAFVQGKLQVKGDVAQAAALGRLMPVA